MATALASFILLISHIPTTISQTTHCNHAFECADAPLVNNSIESHGYHAVSGNSSMNCSSGSCSCYGAYSCEGISSITALSVTCYGANSCSYTTITSSSTYISGSAANSLSYSNLHANSDVWCRGQQSCSYTNISATNWVKVNAAFGLIYSTVNSINSPQNATRVTIYGYYAGFGAKIICQPNHNCIVDCLAIYACYMLTLQCLDGSSCTVFYANNFNVSEPLTDPDLFNASLLYMPPHFDSDILAQQNDAKCNARSNLTFDDHKEHPDAVTIYDAIAKSGASGSICCRGDWSCHQSEAITLNTSNEDIIECNGAYSCLRVPLLSNYNGIISCSGGQSCNYNYVPHIIAKTIYCTGYQSCYRTNMNISQNLYCGSLYGCLEAHIFTFGGGNIINMYFIGSMSAKDTQITCRSGDYCTILCGDYQACLNSVIYCYGTCNVECPSGYKCPALVTLNPTNYPSGSPTTPTLEPTIFPTRTTVDPTSNPSKDPTQTTVDPSAAPTNYPTIDPTIDPTMDPTNDPTVDPTMDPTIDPTTEPTVDPTRDPTSDPTIDPTYDPIIDPTIDPTSDPTIDPTGDPTIVPTIVPTKDPTNDPTIDPSSDPTSDPTTEPTVDPTMDPTVDPTNVIIFDTLTTNTTTDEDENSAFMYPVVTIFVFVCLNMFV